MAGRIDVELAGEVATVVLANPGKRNALDLAMWQALPGVFADLEASPHLRCVVLRGEGGEAFAAGGDLGEFPERRGNTSQALAYHDEVSSALAAISDSRLPSVALIDGACVGGGLEIALACDLAICGESSRFGIPIGRLGFPMAPREMAALLARVPVMTLRELLLEGRLMDAREAQAKGLVTRVVPDAQVRDEAYASARRIAAGAPRVAAAHKAWLRRLTPASQVTQEDQEAAFALLADGDYREGLAAFFARRKPRFRGQ